MSDAAEIARATSAGNAPAGTGTPGKRSRSEVARLAALARWGKYKGKQKAGGGRGKKPAQTAEQKEAARRQEAQDNRAKVMETFGAFGRETLPDLEAMAAGQELDSARADGMVMSGLAERLSTGQVVLTAEGKRLYNAASRGDVGAAKEAIDRAEARAGERIAKEKAKAAAAAEKEKAEAEKPAAGGGGSGGGSSKPSADDKAKEKAEARAKTAAETASRVGLKPAQVDALRQARDEGGAADEALQRLGLIDAEGNTTDQGRRALTALERGDAGQYRAAVQDAEARLEREGAARERTSEHDAARAEREREQAAREAEAESRRSARRRREDAMLAPYRKAMDDAEDGLAIKQTAQDRAMFANMGGSGSGGGGGSAGGGGKPTGGTGGLWAVNPQTGKREPGHGLEKGAPPAPAGSARAEAAKPKAPPKPATPKANDRATQRVLDKERRQLEAEHAYIQSAPHRAQSERGQQRTAEINRRLGEMNTTQKPGTPDKATAQQTFREYSARRKEVNDLNLRATRAEAEAGLPGTPPTRRKELTEQATRDRAQARKLDTDPRNVSDLQTIEGAGYRLGGRRGERLAPARGESMAPKPRTPINSTATVTAPAAPTRLRKGETVYPQGRNEFASQVVRRAPGGYIVRPVNARPGSLADREHFVPDAQASRTVTKAYDMDELKASRRHSAADEGYMQAGMAHLSAARKAFSLAGAPDEDGDGMPDAMKGVPEIADDAHPGAMVCLIVPDDIRDSLPGDEADHVTICYLGGDAATLEDSKAKIVAALAELAACGPAVTGYLGGFARFNASAGSDGQDVLVALVDSPDLPPLHTAVCAALDECDVDPPGDHGFIPHITLRYVAPESGTPRIVIPRIPITFDALSIVWAGERIDLPFAGENDDYEDDDEPVMGYKALPPADVDEDLDLAPVAAVKAVGDYTLTVRGIVYGGHDLVGDTFTKATDLGFGRDPVGMPVFYDHAQRSLKSQIGHVTAWKSDDDGIDFEIELDRRHQYAAMVMGLARKGALGGSTGALSHLVVRERGELKRWIAGELSLTPTPAEPRSHLKADPDSIPTAAATPEAPAEAAHAADGGSAAQLLVATLTNIAAERVARRYR